MSTKPTTPKTEAISANGTKGKNQANRSSAQPNKAGQNGKPGKGKGWPIWVWVIGLVALVWVGIGLYLLLSNGSKEAQPIAKLDVPDVHSLAFSPTNPDTIYFGSHKGLLKSSDGGRNWQPTLLNKGDAMNIAPAKDGKLIYIAGHNLFLKSVDGGQTWRSLINNLLDSEDIHALAIDPANPMTLYAYGLGAGLMKSNDGGEKWPIISKQLGSDTVALAYGNNTLWAAGLGRGVLRSSDGGVTWQAASGFANGALNADVRVTALAYAEKEGMLYAGTGDGLYHSMDGGSSWNRVIGYSGTVAALAVNPANPKNLLLVNSQGAVYRSTDGGVSWPGK